MAIDFIVHLLVQLVDYSVYSDLLCFFILLVGSETFSSLSYQKLMTESSRMPLFDLRKLNSSLPVPSDKDSSLKIHVMGAEDDFIVVNSAL